MSTYNHPLDGKLEKFIEYFVEFYGEKYREKITKNILNTNYYFLPKVEDYKRKINENFDRLIKSGKFDSDTLERKKFCLKAAEELDLEKIYKKAQNDTIDLIVKHLMNGLHVPDTNENKKIVSENAPLYFRLITSNPLEFAVITLTNQHIFRRLWELGKSNFDEINRIFSYEGSREICDKVVKVFEEGRNTCLEVAGADRIIQEVKGLNLFGGDSFCETIEYYVTSGFCEGLAINLPYLDRRNGSKSLCLLPDERLLDDWTLIHETGHSLSSKSKFNGSVALISSGILKTFVADRYNSNNKMSRFNNENHARLNYMNEVITDFFTGEIKELFERDNFEIGKMKGTESGYLQILPIVNDLFEENIDEIKEFYINGDGKGIKKYFGENEFCKLADMLTYTFNLVQEMKNYDERFTTRILEKPDFVPKSPLENKLFGAYFQAKKLAEDIKLNLRLKKVIAKNNNSDESGNGAEKF